MEPDFEGSITCFEKLNFFLKVVGNHYSTWWIPIFRKIILVAMWRIELREALHGEEKSIKDMAIWRKKWKESNLEDKLASLIKKRERTEKHKRRNGSQREKIKRNKIAHLSFYPHPHFHSRSLHRHSFQYPKCVCFQCTFHVFLCTNTYTCVLETHNTILAFKKCIEVQHIYRYVHKL